MKHFHIGKEVEDSVRLGWVVFPVFLNARWRDATLLDECFAMYELNGPCEKQGRHTPLLELVRVLKQLPDECLLEGVERDEFKNLSTNSQESVLMVELAEVLDKNVRWWSYLLVSMADFVMRVTELPQSDKSVPQSLKQEIWNWWGRHGDVVAEARQFDGANLVAVEPFWDPPGNFASLVAKYNTTLHCLGHGEPLFKLPISRCKPSQLPPALSRRPSRLRLPAWMRRSRR